MIWLIGAGPMAVDYFKVLAGLDDELTVIGRSQASAAKFTEATGKSVEVGGLDVFLEKGPEVPQSAIVSVGVEQLAPATISLLDYGVKKILVEKPGGISSKEIEEVAEYARKHNATVIVAYNRRYYASVCAARKMIEDDGGVTSFNFEITEWSHIIQNHDKDPRTMHSWFLGNTSHVVDTAFFLGGEPTEFKSFTSGSLSWHPASSSFSGAGVTNKRALFSYSGNWESPGRWSLDVMTSKRRYIFRPFEQLHVQEIGSVAIDKVEIDCSMEEDFKPGLFLQCKDFLDGFYDSMCSIEEQARMSKVYERMAGY